MITETAKCVIESAANFIASGRVAAPSVVLEGLWYHVLDGQKPHDDAMSAEPLTVAVVNSWSLEARIAWLMNNFDADERYASSWNLARRAMNEFPAEFSDELDRLWQKRTTKNWRGDNPAQA
ncbi:hypothetical protein ABIA06_002085 [Bradyrhizobium yuanmingense]|uniref:hypothetical protein n=1 Tax=Bradyrhizobium yuanmingense TaxID=108015 RepID=UPI00351427AF